MRKLSTLALFAAFNKMTPIKMTKESSSYGYFDDYNCFHMKVDQAEFLNFNSNLQSTLSQCKEKKCKAIWVKLASNQLQFAETLIQQGFEMHHCTEEYLLFSQWLVEGKESKLPKYTTHYLGAGGLILHQGKILLVQEKNGLKKGLWSIPNGLADDNELIPETAVREIKEETNLDVEAKDLLFFREIPKVAYGKGDLYFVVLMNLVNPQQAVEICQKELMDYRWVAVNELNQFMKENKMGITQQRLMEFVQEYMNSDRNKEKKQLFQIDAGTRVMYGKEKKYAMYKPNL